MKVYDAPNIRNIALVGHGGCGKTSLVSAMLFDMGAVSRLGRVDDGTTVTDFDPDETERRISLQTALAFGEWKKTKINLLDAPGYANFLAEARSALRVAEAAIVVVDAVAGVEVKTQKVWSYAEEYGLPRMIVVNRMDRERASFSRTLESLERSFGRGAVPLVIPLGEEKGFVGVTDLLTEKADVYTDDQSGKYQAVEVPEDLRQAVLAGKIFPVFPASSLRNVGIQPILDDVVDLLPSPVDRGEVNGIDPVHKTEVSGKPSPEAPFSAFVFKTIADPHAGRL